MDLSPETIRSHLAESSLVDEYGLDIVVLDEIDSSNDWVLAQCQQGRVLPFVCFAEKQTGGRGRRGKQWLQSQNANVAMSLALSCVYEREAIAHLALAVALSVVYALEEMGVQDCQIKWPNDVLVAGEKIAGILIETVPLPKGQQLYKPGGDELSGDKSRGGEPDEAAWAAIIGIGLNYDMSALRGDESLEGVTWTDLVSVLDLASDAQVVAGEVVAGKVATGRVTAANESMSLEKPMLQRSEVAAMVLRNCLKICSAYPDNVSDLRASFEVQYDYCRGKEVTLLLNDGKTLQGLAMGLSDNAELIVQVEGVEQVFHSADVSVRPVVGK